MESLFSIQNHKFLVLLALILGRVRFQIEPQLDSAVPLFPPKSLFSPLRIVLFSLGPLLALVEREATRSHSLVILGRHVSGKQETRSEKRAAGQEAGAGWLGERGSSLSVSPPSSVIIIMQ